MTYGTSSSLFVIGNVMPQNGGVTHALLARANALVDMSARVVLATINYDPNFVENVEYHKSTGNLDPRVEVVSQYESWQGRPAGPRVAERVSGWTYFADARRENVFRVFNEAGEYVRYESRRDSGALEFVDHFATPWTRVRKTIYDARGVARKELYMSHATNKPEFQVTRDNLGRPFVSSKLDQSGRPTTYFSHIDQIEYRSELEMAVPWLQHFVDSMDDVVLFIDKREFVVPLAALKGDRIKRVFVMHNTHLEKPFFEPLNVSPSISDAFEGVRSGHIDKMVFLTDRQADDAAIHIGSRDRLEVIPHYVNPVHVDGVPRERNLLVTLARYHPQKNLGAALEVFARVLEKVPDARYEIFGYGPELAELQRIAEGLGISRSVKFAGFTKTSADSFARASASLLTSRYEGFGLVLLESMAVGTPVVSFDTKYGPAEVIRDGVDGFVVPYGDEGLDAAAEAIVRIFSDSTLSASMRKACLEVTERFSKEKTADLWRKLFASI